MRIKVVLIVAAAAVVGLGVVGYQESAGLRKAIDQFDSLGTPASGFAKLTPQTYVQIGWRSVVAKLKSVTDREPGA